ncbi:MAG: hypothetical protein JOZ14_13705 [Acidobacteria bacterium]|nr:hypothetical protein [Acidobacteriota bacterium]
MHPGTNALFIHVIDPPMDEVQNRELFPEMMYNEIPHGKQNWYVQNSGIWQGVRIELCPSIYIERLDIVPDVTGEFEVIARLAGVGLTSDNGAIAAATQLEIEILDWSRRSVFSEGRMLVPGSHTEHIKGKVKNPKLWEPDNPALYVLNASLRGPIEYHRRTRFGFRSFEARHGKVYLNGKPFFMIAALDQDFYPETVHTPTSEEFVPRHDDKSQAAGDQSTTLSSQSCASGLSRCRRRKRNADLDRVALMERLLVPRRSFFYYGRGACGKNVLGDSHSPLEPSLHRFANDYQ